MRSVSIPILCLLALAACRREPSFDERYDAANEKIRDTAAQIDAQMSEAPTSAPEEATRGDESL